MLLNLRRAIGLALLGLIFAVGNAAATEKQDQNSLDLLSAAKSGNSSPFHAFGPNLDEAGGTPGGEKGKPSTCGGCLPVERDEQEVKEKLERQLGHAPGFDMLSGAEPGREEGGVKGPVAPAGLSVEKRVPMPYEAAAAGYDKKAEMTFVRVDNLKKRAVGQLFPGIRRTEPDPAYCSTCGGCC